MRSDFSLNSSVNVQQFAKAVSSTLRENMNNEREREKQQLQHQQTVYATIKNSPTMAAETLGFALAGVVCFFP